MSEDLGSVCSNFQNMAADLVERLQPQTPCAELGPFNCITLDHSKGRIFLHPTPRHQLTSLPSPPEAYEEGSLQRLTDENPLRISSSSAPAECAGDECRESGPEAGYVATFLQQPNTSGTDDLSRNQVPEAAAAHVPEDEYDAAVQRASEKDSGGRGAAGGYEHEDDLIAALLGCSDEEEGSSSELTCNFGLLEEDHQARLPGKNLKKREHEEIEVIQRQEDEEEEVDSARFNKRHRSQEELDDEVDDICVGICSCSSASVVDAFSGDSFGPSCPQQEEYYEEGDEDDYQELDESTLELQMLCDDFGLEMPEEEQQCSSCSKEDVEEGDTISSGSARKSRRAKIKQTVKLLRNLIPGGNCMDTAIVLDEAIHYVKLLQLQVQTLEAKRLVDRVQ